MIDDLLKTAGIFLDIGCGANRQDGWVGMDIRPLPNVDIVQDVEQFPWPLPDECVKTAMASHLETVRDARVISPKTSGTMAHLWATTLPTPPAPMMRTLFMGFNCVKFSPLTKEIGEKDLTGAETTPTSGGIGCG